MTDDQRIRQLEKIRGLLNQAESTTFPEEARAFTEKAQDLMTKYALSDYDLRKLDDASAPDVVETREVKVQAPHTQAKGQIFTAAAAGNGCKVVFGHGDIKHERGPEYFDENGNSRRAYINLAPKDRYRVLYVTGFKRDIDNVEMLYTSLLLQATRELLTTERPPWENARTWNKSFYYGYGKEIKSRLADRRRTVAQDTVVVTEQGSHNLLPVLASRDAQVKAEHEARWKGQLRSIPAGRIGYNAYGAGQKAGARANVGDPSVGSRGVLGR